MLVYAASLFGLAAVGGLYLAAGHLRGQTPPLAVAILHGLLAGAGVLVLLKVVLDGGAGRLPWSLGCFVVAALGGAVLLIHHIRGKELPKGLIGVHAVVAVAGFLLLLAVIL